LIDRHSLRVANVFAIGLAMDAEAIVGADTADEAIRAAGTFAAGNVTVASEDAAEFVTAGQDIQSLSWACGGLGLGNRSRSCIRTWKRAR
jgi:hypothetical protein